MKIIEIIFEMLTNVFIATITVLLIFNLLLIIYCVSKYFTNRAKEYLTNRSG